MSGATSSSTFKTPDAYPSSQLKSKPKSKPEPKPKPNPLQVQVDPETLFTNSIIPDLPLLMYGSGDAHPTQIDPATTHLVATLTTNYVQRLVEAAVDAHDILTDGAGGVLPPPKFQKRKRDDWGADENDDDRNKPRIKNKTKSIKKETEGTMAKDSAGNRDRGGKGKESLSSGSGSQKLIKDEEWQGVKGIDFYENRIRKNYNSIPGTIGAQSFIFPICHDAELYNRVKELNAFEVEELKALKSDEIGALVDSTVLDCIKEEEGGFDHLASSVFHWVSSGKTASANIAAATSTTTTAADDKVAAELAIAKRKEMARRMVARTRLEAQLPGVEDILVPLHSVKDHTNE